MSNNDYELVMFDLDGTLIEFHHDYLFQQTHQILDQIGHPPVSQTVLNDCFSDFDYFRFFDPQDRDPLVGRFWELFDWNSFPAPRPFSQSKKILHDLCEHGYQVALVTSRFVPEAELREKLAPTGFLEHFAYIKPRPGDHIHWTDKRQSIVEVCEKLSVSPARAVMIGDIPPDITSAKEVGVGKTVAVLSGGIRESVLRQSSPCHIVPDIAALRQILGLGKQ